MIKRVIGVLMLISVFAGIIAIDVIEKGFTYTLIYFGLAFALIAFLVLAIYLIATKE